MIRSLLALAALMIGLPTLIYLEAKSITYKIDCDSGFSTGVVNSASIDDGVIMWTAGETRDLSRRKMLPGEICKPTKIEGPAPWRS